MLTSVFAKAIRDRWIGMSVATGVLSLWLLLAMAIYQDIDLSIYTDLPEGVRGLMGIPEGADAATLAYNVMLGFAAALTLAGMAVSIGSAAIAGEERAGTIGLLLGNPESRSHLLISKLASMFVLVAAATVLLWGAAALAPSILGVEIGNTDLGAMSLHLGINSLFYGLLALAIGAWTGNRTLASSVPAAVMAISYFAVGLLPLIDSLAGGARLFPWYYFSSSEPLVNGVNWRHLLVLAGACMILGAVAFVGLGRRDLRGPGLGGSVLDRLRSTTGIAPLFERLAGSTRVSRIWIKRTSEHQALVLTTAAVMFTMMGLMMGPMYVAIEDDIATAADDFPEIILALAGDGDLSTPEGWFTVETFSLMAPIAVIVVTVVIATRAIAGEEANRTMGLLLANPLRRSRVIYENLLAMVVYASVVGLATLAGVAGANLISGLDMSYGGIVAICVHVTLLGLVFGSLALALSAATGRSRAVIFGTVGIGLSSHLLNSFLPLSDRLAGWARLTPHHYFLASDPINNGMHWGHAGVLAAIIAVFVFVAVWTFERRDLRQG